ncbi:MAG: MFS transporter [bacterium]|nr:MFS transporter [bacterium]
MLMNRKTFNTVHLYYAFSFFKAFSLFSAVLIPFFTVWGGISLFRVQLLQSWFMFWIFILEIPTGIVADRFGRKYSLAAGGVIVALAAILYGSFPRFEMFLAGEFLFAIAIAFMSGADKALLYDALKESNREEDSKKVFGRAKSFEYLAMFVSAPLGGIVAAKFGLNAPMLFSCIPFLLAAIIAFLINEPKRYQTTLESRRYLDIAKKGISFLRHHKKLRIIAIDGILVAAAAYFVVWFYQALLIRLNVPVLYFGYFHAFLVATEIIITSNFVRLEKLFGSGKNFLKFGTLATGATFLLVAVLPNVFTVILFLLFAGGFGLTRLELMFVYMNKLIPSEQRATILSSISMFKRFMLVALNPLVGLIADKSLTIALFLVGALSLGLFILSPLKKETLEPLNENG